MTQSICEVLLYVVCGPYNCKVAGHWHLSKLRIFIITSNVMTIIVITTNIIFVVFTTFTAAIIYKDSKRFARLGTSC